MIDLECGNTPDSLKNIELSRNCLFGMNGALPEAEQPALEGKEKMKSKTLFAAATVLLTPVLAFGASKNSAKFTLDEPVTVAGTALAPGEYKLTWEGTGPDVTVNFAEGKTIVASATAHLVNNRNEEEAIETNKAADNTTVLQEIDLNKLTIQFQNAATSTGN